MIEYKKDNETQRNNLCVLASTRSWNRNMAKALIAKTGSNFILISDKKELTSQNLVSINPRFIFFPHWSHRIDSSIYNQFECVIFHMTDLPFGRGGSPLQNLISRGIYETKITALRCVAEMDGGPIYLKKPLSLYGSAEEIFLRASRIIEDMIIELLDKQPFPVEQEGEPTVFKRRKQEESDLSSAKSLEEVFDKIRMLDAEGYPNAVLHIGKMKIEFTRASIKTSYILADARICFTEDFKDKNT